MHNEQMKKYIQENIPKKQYVYKIRPRRPGEIFIGEVLFALFLIFMLVMLYLNYESNLKYQAQNNKVVEQKNVSEIDINVNIEQENYSQHEIIYLSDFIKYTLSNKNF